MMTIKLHDWFSGNMLKCRYVENISMEDLSWEIALSKEL